MLRGAGEPTGVGGRASTLSGKNIVGLYNDIIVFFVLIAAPVVYNHTIFFGCDPERRSNHRTFTLELLILYFYWDFPSLSPTAILFLWSWYYPPRIRPGRTSSFMAPQWIPWIIILALSFVRLWTTRPLPVHFLVMQRFSLTVAPLLIVVYRVMYYSFITFKRLGIEYWILLESAMLHYLVS